MKSEHQYWFPTRRYGWGWGIPRIWQGWAVLAAYAALLSIGTLVFPPRSDVGIFPYVGYMGVVSALLVLVCWLKGEPPRWRWGGE